MLFFKLNTYSVAFVNINIVQVDYGIFKPSYLFLDKLLFVGFQSLTIVIQEKIGNLTLPITIHNITINISMDKNEPKTSEMSEWKIFWLNFLLQAVK